MIDKDTFTRFVKVQKSGVCNMFSKRVPELAHITYDEHLYIIHHYSELSDEYSVNMDNVSLSPEENNEYYEAYNK